MKLSNLNQLPRRPALSHLSGLIVLILFAVIGTALVLSSRAATLPLASEAEAGLAGGSAAINFDAAASGGQSVRFAAPPPIASCANHTLYVANSQGDCVRRLQAALNKLNLSNLPINGQYDLATVAAVTAFQQRYQMAADGVAGSHTWSAVESGLATGRPVVFPLNTTQAKLKAHRPMWCHANQANCHHDYPAADIFMPVGTEVVAAVAGTVSTFNNKTTCTAIKGGSPKMQIRGIDGRYYFYNHFAPGSLRVALGQKVKAGQVLGIIGPAECAQGTPPHLHLQMYTSPITGNATSMNVQPILTSAFLGLPD